MEISLDNSKNQPQAVSTIQKLQKKNRPGEQFIQGLLFLCGAISIATTIGIIYELGKESLLFFTSSDVNLIEFLTTTLWQPKIGAYGVIPLVNATLMTSFFAMLIALPLGLASAIYLSEYASQKLRSTLKPILEILAGVPTVVYGYFALTFMTPLLKFIFGQDTVNVYNTLSAGLVMGILILPLVEAITTLCIRIRQ